jgi:hypothetical protein
MNKSVKYAIISAGEYVSRNIVGTSINLGLAVKNGLVNGYEDAKHHYHSVRKETNPGKILRNAVVIIIAVPAGTAIGPAYFIYRHTAVLFERLNGQNRDNSYNQDSERAVKESGLETI